MGKPRRPKAGASPVSPSRRRDVELAAVRLGGVDDRCRWILDDFTARGLETLSTTERALWRDNLMALVLGPKPVGGGTARWMTIGEDEPLDEDLPDIWAGAVKLVGAHRAPAPLPSLTSGLVLLPSNPDAQPKVKTPYVRLTRSYQAGYFESAVLHAIADLLIACERLRECSECKRLFVANRKQEFHKVCARRKRDREWNKARKQKGKG